MSVSVAHKIFLCISIIGFGGLQIFLGVALHLAYQNGCDAGSFEKLPIYYG
jgi:hypothetical protein